MSKSMKFLTTILVCAGILCPFEVFAKAKTESKEAEPTTRSDAVIFKVHNIEPVSEDGIVKGCNYMVTLYNRTSLNFRTFTINLDWLDEVDERFKFDRYVEKVLGSEEAEQQKMLFVQDETPQDTPTLHTSITVNAFGMDKQISLRSYVENEKCYLMLNKANFTVTPCEIARNMDGIDNSKLNTDGQDCSTLFQLVDTKNPEYFKEFKNISLTEVNAINQSEQTSELSDIDVVINKIVDNMGTADTTLTKIY